MKVNFNRPFVDSKGQRMKENINDVIANYLFNLQEIDGKPASQDEKVNAYSLCRRIGTSVDSVEISVEEATFIKKVCHGHLQAGPYGQIAEIIEK